MASDLETCCLGLESTKITERKKNADLLWVLIENKSVLRMLNDSKEDITWNTVVASVHGLLLKEAEKFEDERKKKTTTVSGTNYSKRSYGDLLIFVLRKANAKGTKVNVSKLIRIVLDCFNSDALRKYFSQTYLIILKDHILSVKNYWGDIKSTEWLNLLCCLKKFYQSPISGIEDLKPLQCLQLLLQWGPLHSLPSTNLRQEFPFILQIARQINTSSPRLQLEAVLKLLTEFCFQTAEDNRMSCCKMGEELFSNFIGIYQAQTHDTIKALILDFFLLQVQIHHPKGALEGSVPAYACSWREWHKHVRSLYSILCHEVDNNIQAKFKPSTLLGNQRSINILPTTFVTLLIEVFRQVYGNRNTSALDITDTPDSSQPPSKRLKIEVGISAIISNIQDSKDWPWINIMTELLRKYPDLMTTKDFISLLRVLSACQAECKYSNIRHHLYDCLSVLVDVEAHIDIVEYTEVVNSLWSVVWECTLRAVGLNENEEQTHKLLQKLISERKTLNSTQLFRTYMSQVLNVTPYSLQTLHVACCRFGLPLTPLTTTINLEDNRKTLQNWILNVDFQKCTNLDVFSEPITAQVLIFLTLRQWPAINTSVKPASDHHKFNTIEYVYLITSFDGGLVLNENKDTFQSDDKLYTSDDKVCYSQCDGFNNLNGLLYEFALSFLQVETRLSVGVKNITNVLILFANVFSYMISYDLLQEDNLEEHKLMSMLNLLLEKWWDLLQKVLEKLNERNLNCILDVLRHIKQLFTTNLQDAVLLMLRQKIPIDFIKQLFHLLNQEEPNKENEGTNQEPQSENQAKHQSEKLSLTALDVLCSYCTVPNARCRFDVQQHALETLADPNFDPELQTDYTVAMTFLQSLQKYEPGTLSDNVLDMILKGIQNICQVYYSNYYTALNVLKILYDLYPHVALSNNEELQENAVLLLYPFYDQSNNYGPNVSAALVNCMGQLFKVDPDMGWSKWNGDQEIAGKIPHFLNSDFQQVRLAAIKNLHIVFETFSKNYSKLTCQNAIFSAICNQCVEVFNVDGELSEERQIDETVTRTASALHTLAMVIATSVTLRQKSLFALLRLVCEKKLNMDSTSKVLNMVTKHLCIQDPYTFLEINLNYLVSQWHSKNYPLNKFPYELLGCSSEMDFYAKYTSVMVPVLIAKDLSLLANVCEHHGKSVEQIVETSYPNIIARCLLISMAESCTDTITQEEKEYKNKCLQNFVNILTKERSEKLLIAKLDEVVGEIIHFCFDPDDICDKFSIRCALPEPQHPFFSVPVVLKTISNIEDIYLDKNILTSYCIAKCPEKLQKVLLKTIAAVHNATSMEDKVKAFHQCSVLIDLIEPWLKKDNQLRVYFIRTISYMLVHLIRNKYEDDAVLNIMCCKYFYSFLHKILPENAEVVEMFLVTFVSILVPVTKCDNTVGLECTKLLNLMIVDHENDLIAAIKTLDPFPQDDKFFKMREVCERVKYGGNTFTLEDELQRFLNTGNLMSSAGYRTEGLKHLRKQLSCKKDELKEIYSKLHNLRGFSEDCEKSILHQLICTLVKLSFSTDSDESVEAARCLGELGPADLLTTILQAERKYEQENWSSFELVTGCITALLSRYIIDFDVEVMQVASDALYYVLDCKEGKTVLASEVDYGQGIINKLYVIPFISSRKIRSESSYALKNNFDAVINCNELWCPEVPMSHTEWITKLVCTLLERFTDKCYLSNLIPVCKAKVAFSVHLLPMLVYLILSSRYADVVSTQIKRFFEMHWMCSLHEHRNENIALNKLSVQCMLNVVHFIRLRKSIETNRSFGDLSLNYLQVAEAAQYCTAHFTALLYVELWCQERLKEIRTQTKSTSIYTSGVTPLDTILEHEPPDIRQTLQSILKEGYKKVGEMDALRTCEMIGFLDNSLGVEHYEHLQRWDQVTLLYDIKVSQGNIACIPKLLHALKNCNLFQLPLKYENHVESQFECAWRLSQWNISKTDSESVESYEKYKYFAIKALHDNDASNFNCALTDARSFVVNGLRHANLESSKNLYEPLSQLQSLQELEDFVKAKNEANFEPLFKKWEIQDEINRNEFHYMESIQAQRLVIVNDLVTSGHDSLKDALVEMHLKLAGLARTEGKHNVATRTLGSLLHVANLTPEVQNKIMLEKAQMSWADDKTTARYILRNLLNKSPNPRLHSAVLKLCGMWMIETCSENPQTIISDYFLESLKILNNLQKSDDDNAVIYETYDVLARFADSQYQQILTYIKSSVFECKVQNMQKAKETAADIHKQSNGAPSEDERKAILTHERQSLIDNAEINNTFKEKNMYLKLALKYYMMNLQCSDANNVRMFRIFSLWLENRSSADIEELLRNYLQKISSYKYIPILPQLTPHITSNKEDSFGNKINAIIERCAVDHPHHTLPVILALAHSNADRKYYKSTTNTTSNELRVAGAEKMVQKFKSHGHFLKQLVNRMEILSKALMELAYLNYDKCRTVKDNFIIPSSASIMKIKNFDDVMVPTYTMEIKKNCDYSQLVGIHSFGKIFANAGGLNAPKRITCLGTDGQSRVQLVKGKDDLRQDAVMQQVFNIMNGLLKSNKQTAKLLIRTYKIVPLSQRSGILEWVANSMPLSDYLVGKDGKPGAHQRYNRNDITPAQCRNKFKDIAKLPNEDKLRIYKDICCKFQPVFHKFFEQSFVQPAVWYERRRAYMYSVATSSMCGYILGLGDRHVLNILLDKNTAEVVHIDFGIAFEQGLVLPTPETVPFRLTRDMEAGMGVSGIEGVFRKSCERTLEVLRKNAETIITIVEVLLYDPLYAWTITPAEAYSRQFKDDQDTSTNNTLEFSDQENASVNITAERALLRLRQKLQGTTEGGSTSIEGQVEKLIQQARDPSHLCRLYHGWQPYL